MTVRSDTSIRDPDGRGDAPVVLFDLDGTLIASKKLYGECYLRALTPVLGHRPSVEELLALKPRAERRFLPDQAADDAAGERCLEDFYQHYRELHPDFFEGVYAGVPELLGALRGRKARMGIVTGKSRRAWEITCGHVDLGPFDVVICDDDVAEPKPDPEGVRRALDALGAGSDGALYVGDTMGDVLAARAAGARAGAALWSKRDEERAHFVARVREQDALLLHTPEELLRTVTGA